MTGYERYRAVLRGAPADRPPRTPILMRFAAECIGATYGEFLSDHRVLVEANARCAAEFDFDQVSCISDPYRETAGFGARLTIVPDATPLCEPPLAETRDLDHLSKPDPLKSPRMRDRIEAARAFHERFNGRYSILGWIEGPAAEAADLRGVSAFLMDLIREPAYAGELMALCTEVGIEFAQAQLDAGVDTVGIGDAIASQVSPRIYERLIQPRQKRLVNGIHRVGGLVKLHVCGDITHLLPGIADLGVDVLDVDHMVDLGRVREAVGKRVAITGNMDPVACIHDGTPASIGEAVRTAYSQAGSPYLVNAGCEIPPGTPLENLHALCDAVKTVG